MQAKLLGLGQKLCTQGSIPTYEQDIVIAKMCHSLDQMVVPLIRDKTSHIEDNLLTWVLRTYCFDLIREPRIGIYADREKGRFLLYLTKEG